MIFFCADMIDLHTHSTASDGTYRPSELVQCAAQKKLSVLALTDHDTISGITEASASAKDCGITLVPGIELSIQWPSGEFHLLGLGLQFISPELAELAEELCDRREQRNIEMAEKLRSAGIEITYEEVAARFPQKTIGRPHFAAVMQEKGYIRNRQQAFERYFASGRPCYVPRTGVNLEQAVEAIAKSGGIPVQAHPLSMYVSWGKMEETMRGIHQSGVQGLEAWHPGARVSEAQRLEQLAHGIGMCVTGGSDFHGKSVRADRHLGFASGGYRIPERCYTEELLPALMEYRARHMAVIPPNTALF